MPGLYSNSGHICKLLWRIFFQLEMYLSVKCNFESQTTHFEIIILKYKLVRSTSVFNLNLGFARHSRSSLTLQKEGKK